MAEVDSPVRVEECEVAIIGAGIAGMNALFVACQYLSPDQRIILVDSRSRAGGMWVDTYPYVRLHQPHEFFTAGNIPWELDVERSHLATKGEVLDQFEHCMRVLQGKARIDTFFGYTAEAETEAEGVVSIPLIGVDDPDDRVEVRAKRLIVATGVNVQTNDPLTLSSARVHSISPDHDDLASPEMSGGDEPIWVIGGGKTGVDTALALVTRYPGREVHLVAGSGTAFINRDRAFPDGAIDRWFSGVRSLQISEAVSRRYTGTNGHDVLQQFIADGTLISLVDQPRHYLFGVVSLAEMDRLRADLRAIHVDHLVDAVDLGDDVQLVFRSGRTVTIPTGSWIVNCTGYLWESPDGFAPAPYVSPRGSVLRIQPRVATFVLSSFIGYYVTHLFLLDKAREVPLYEIDFYTLAKAAPEELPWVLYAQTSYNLGPIADVVPNSVFNDCGLTFDLWYPKPRQLFGGLRFLALRKRLRPRQKAAMDTVRERYGVRCGPLEPASV